MKPDNIGFDAAGCLKLFDFGLAKRLKEDSSEEFYLLTGNTGSLRYMAPEVALDEPYNFGVDVYSFGIILWQICSLTTPFQGYSQKTHADRVVRDGQRPKPDKTWPASWVALMEECWGQDKTARPTFAHVEQNLSDRVADLELDDGVVPTRASEIRAKKRKKKRIKKDPRLDVDTRLSVASGTDGKETTENHVKRFESDVV